MIDIEKLKQVARDPTLTECCCDVVDTCQRCDALDKFQETFTPALVLELLLKIEQLEIFKDAITKNTVQLSDQLKQFKAHPLEIELDELRTKLKTRDDLLRDALFALDCDVERDCQSCARIATRIKEELKCGVG